MSFIFGGNTGLTYEQLQQRRKALEARKGTRYRAKTAGDGLAALGHALGTRLESGRLAKAETARRGRADEAFSAFQTILGGGQNTPTDLPPTTPDMPTASTPSQTGGDTSDMAGRIYSGLVDRGMPDHVARGVLANMKAESRLETGINEIAPLVEGSRGGYGLNQWTGPRRRAYEAYAKERGVSLDDLDTQLDFTMQELQGPEKRAWAALQQTKDPLEAAQVYSKKFLRPGIPHMDKRLAYAQEFSNAQFGKPIEVASADPNQAFQMSFAPQSEPQKPAQSALQTLLARRNGGGQPQPQTTPPVQPAKPAPYGGIDPRLIDLMGNPDISPQRRSAMQFLLQQHLQQQDPMRQMQMEKMQLQNEQMRRSMDAGPKREIMKDMNGRQRYLDTGEPVFAGVEPIQEPGYRMLTPDQVQQMGLPEGNYQQGPKGRVTKIGGGGTNVTVNNGPSESAFAKTTGNELAKSTNELAVAGDAARRNLSRIDRLESLLNESPSGIAGVAKNFASSIGLGGFVNASDVEAAQALISSMVPEQRPAGSGTMSDADLALFKQSLPQIINSEGGNQKIIQTLRGIGEYDIQRGEIARQLQLGEISPKQAFEAYGSLKNPLGWLNEKPDEISNEELLKLYGGNQ